jgi:hypothetical protein
MNPWYGYTYEAIFGMAKWYIFPAEIDRKMVCIFSWMPQTIMNINMPGGKKRFEFTVEEVSDAAQRAFNALEDYDSVCCCYCDFEIDKNRTSILNTVRPLFDVLGPVTASKFLHFSRPCLFPMWDRAIAIQSGFPGLSVDDYVDFMKQFQDELCVPENMEVAKRNYPRNPVRGWDIEKMKNRGQPGNGEEVLD